jgi:putrescine transport system permease protein
VFRDITLPLSIPGIIAGGLACLHSRMGELIIPQSRGQRRRPDDRPRHPAGVRPEPRLAHGVRRCRGLAAGMLVVPLMLYNHFEAKSAEAEPRE